MPEPCADAKPQWPSLIRVDDPGRIIGALAENDSLRWLLGGRQAPFVRFAMRSSTSMVSEAVPP